MALLRLRDNEEGEHLNTEDLMRRSSVAITEIEGATQGNKALKDFDEEGRVGRDTSRHEQALALKPRIKGSLEYALKPLTDDNWDEDHFKEF